MKIYKWVDFGQEVAVDIGAEDISGVLAEAFSKVEEDQLGESLPIHYVFRSMNYIGAFLNGFKDEHIAMLTEAQRKTISGFLAKAAERFNP